MPKVIGKDQDGRDIVRSDPAEGCRWQCMTCGTFLREKQEVFGHWALASRGHSVFLRLGTGKVHHCTIEGLHERDWEVEPPQATADPRPQHSDCREVHG